MKWLIVNTDYPEFIRRAYAEHPGLEHATYDEQWRARVATLFGVADFYSTHLRELGHEAWDVIANCEPLQKQWARERGLACGRDTSWRVRLRRGFVLWPSRELNRSWLYEILEAQLKEYRPDVFYSMAIETLGSDFIRRAKRYCRLTIGQHAAPHPAHDIGACRATAPHSAKPWRCSRCCSRPSRRTWRTNWPTAWACCATRCRSSTRPGRRPTRRWRRRKRSPWWCRSTARCGIASPCPAGTPDAELERLALAAPRVQPYLQGKAVRKVVVVPNKLVSIVVG